MMKNKFLCLLMSIGMLMTTMIADPAVQAEGTEDLTMSSGNRAYTEQISDQFSQHMSVMHVYLKEDETAYFGTSVSDAQLYKNDSGKLYAWLFSNSAMGTEYTDDQLVYANTGDIYITQGNYTSIAEAIGAGKTPGKDGVVLIDLPSDSGKTTPGYIYDREQEAGGVDITGKGSGYKVTGTNTISSDTSGYIAGIKTNANTFTAPSEGIYTVVFFSSSQISDDPLMKSIDDTTPFSDTQGNGSIASWDISVYQGKQLQTGRVFTNMLYLNAGGNAFSYGGVSTGSLYAKMYAVTSDGYQYQIDLNGLDPSELSLYASRRGLLSLHGDDSSSLMHSVRSDSNTFSDLSTHNINFNQSLYNPDIDANFNLFFEKPSDDVLNALGIGQPQKLTSSDISDFAFTGANDATANEGYAGQGGTFSFTLNDTTATSYQIELDFSSINGGKVILSNALVSGINSIYWNGRDANGNIVPAGPYNTVSLMLKNGECHFPLLDAEQNPNGIKITRLNGEDTDKDTVYYNNSASGIGDTASPWMAANWTVADETDATSGIDSSSGAMKFTNEYSQGSSLAGDGDKAALDVWTYGSIEAKSLGSYSFSLFDTSFTVAAAFDNTAGTPSAGNPSSVTMTLEYADGTIVTEDALGNAITNPATLDSSNNYSYTWNHLNPAMTYQAVETPLTGYTTTSVPSSSGSSYQQTFTNTYTPTTLTITCNWDMNGSNAELPASASFNVYTDKDKKNQIGTYTLPDKNSWTITIENQDPTQSYYVYEDSIDGFTSSPGGKAFGNASNGFKFIFTNTYNNHDYAIAQALVQWDNANNDVSYQPGSVQITLLQDNVPVSGVDNPVTLSDANGWYYAWTQLPTIDSTKKYSFSESVVPGYTVATDPAYPPLVLGSLYSIIFNNSSITTSFQVNKTWDNGSGTQPESATVQLQQSIDGANYQNFGEPVILNSSNKWSNQWSGLPIYTSDGTKIQYKAIEDVPAGYTVSYGDVTDDEHNNYAQTITDTYSYTNFTVSDASDIHPASTKITIKDNTGNSYDTCTLNASNNWTYTFTNLPALDSDNNKITYTAEQNALINYKTSSNQNGNSATFTNTSKTASFTATATFANGINAMPPDSVTMQLQRSKDGKTYTNYGQPVEFNQAGGWTYHWTELPAYNASGRVQFLYRVVETVPTGYTAAEKDVSGTVDDGFTQEIDNTYAFTKITVSDTSTGTRPDSTKITLRKNGSAYDTCSLSSTNSWTYVFANLPIWDSDGEEIVYTLSQSAVDHYITSGGTLSGTYSDGYTASFENVYAPAPTSSATADTRKSSSASEKTDSWCITYLDCKGNTVSVQWVPTGGSPLKPAGFDYPDISNVSAHQDVHPSNCKVSTQYIVPNTSAK